MAHTCHVWLPPFYYMAGVTRLKTYPIYMTGFALSKGQE